MQTSSLATMTRARSDSLAPHIEYEKAWRNVSGCAASSGSANDRIAVARWTLPDAEAFDTGRATIEECYVVGVSLRSMRVSFFYEGKPTFEGRVMPGMYQVTSPGDCARAVFHTGCDVLHFLVPETMIQSLADELGDCRDAPDLLRRQVHIVHDPCIERLANAMLFADKAFKAYGQLYIDSISMALLCRLLEPQAQRRATPARLTLVGLPKWRLMQVTDYIEAHLADSIRLEDLADAAGLTRMHFAAQFRVATGFRPHDYVLRRRIERAKEILSHGKCSLLDAAQRVGFQSQAHFTTVFKRIVGTTPKCWQNTELSRSA
ncbi:helix-turn-helix domain-containing protein [Paraburkholderia silviterrae]|uniref:AraC family transcriptional regulator n=1 Tax=Paraburkholderia silviterrae TaxID=2528715 RepID=A0A4R5M9U9_9BURK|nr:AraC family transcriptional regulator [Paraburkholderia silviterrae]TDG22767.1 AraC family transcriptional regulator [Paraburkholderia silviterrae]